MGGNLPPPTIVGRFPEGKIVLVMIILFSLFLFFAWQRDLEDQQQDVAVALDTVRRSD